jgi:hypothetical protein
VGRGLDRSEKRSVPQVREHSSKDGPPSHPAAAAPDGPSASSAGAGRVTASSSGFAGGMHAPWRRAPALCVSSAYTNPQYLEGFVGSVEEQRGCSGSARALARWAPAPPQGFANRPQDGWPCGTRLGALSQNAKSLQSNFQTHLHHPSGDASLAGLSLSPPGSLDGTRLRPKPRGLCRALPCSPAARGLDRGHRFARPRVACPWRTVVRLLYSPWSTEPGAGTPSDESRREA